MAIRNDLGIDGQLPMAVDAAYQGIIPAAPSAVPTGIKVAQNTASTPPAVVTIALEDGNIARLPAGTDISQVSANGADLQFVQPDGTVIVIPGGAIANLVLFIGDIQIPPDAVELMFTSNGIQPAAGPEGGAGGDGAHGSFVDLTQQTVGPQGDGTDLLGDSDLPGGTFSALDVTATNFAPVILDSSVLTGTVSEDGLANGNLDAGESSSTSVTGTIVVSDVGSVTYAFGVPAAPGVFTSGGLPVTFFAAGGTLVGTVPGSPFPVLIATINAGGVWTLTISQPLDHPVEGEDSLVLNIPVTVTDTGLLSTPVTLVIDVSDDIPRVIGTETFSTADTAAGSESEGALPSLGIRWGADAGDTTDGDWSKGDRAVVFTTTESGPNIVNSKGLALTSLGEEVHYLVSNGGRTITAYVGDLTGEAPNQAPAEGSTVFTVTIDDNGNGHYDFNLLRPLDHGNAVAEGGEESTNPPLTLTFGFNATDADGDDIGGTFTVEVADGTASIGKTENGTVEEEQPAVNGAGIEDTSADPDSDSDFRSGFLNLTFNDRTTDSAGGSLGVSWGPDNASSRSLQFTQSQAALAALNLESRGDTVHYAVIDNVLIAFTGDPESPPTSLPDSSSAALANNIVFTVSLDDTSETGTWSFRLYDTIEAYDSNGDAIQGENTVNLTFSFTATDSDGDTTAPATFSVGAIDDTLVALTQVFPAVGVTEEEQLPGGIEDTTAAIDVDIDSNSNPNRVTQTASSGLGILWGGDDADTADTTVSGWKVQDAHAANDGQRYMQFAAADGEVSAQSLAAFLTVTGNNGPVSLSSLTSHGTPLTFWLSENGSVLTAKVGETSTVAFKVALSDDNDGSFKFVLSAPIDHPVTSTGGAGGEDQLAFAFNYNAFDGDGDKITGSFIVSVIDDVPTAGSNADIWLDEDNLTDPAGNAVAQTGDHDAQNTSGTLAHTYGADGAGSTLLTGADVPAGQNLSASVDVTGKVLTITQIQDGEPVEVLKVTLTDTTSGNYTVTHLNAIRHPDGSNENDVEFTIKYQVKDGDNDIVNSTVKLSVDDDAPIANDDPSGDGGDYTATEGTPAAHNLMLAFDISGSMTENDDGSNTYNSRLAFARAAAVQLINASDAEYVLVVTFANDAQSHGWMTRANAISFLQGNSFPTPSGGTDYDDALTAIQNAYEASHPAGDATVYFFSDGAPSGGGDDINSTELATWNTFLQTNGIDSYAVGFGNDVNGNDGDLLDVARPDAGHVIILDSGDLNPVAALTNTAPQADGAHGNVLDNDDFGADGGRILSITVGEETYTWDGDATITKSSGGTISGSFLSVDTPIEGHLFFNFSTGAWTYQAPEEAIHNTNETFTYTIVDGDWDTAEADLTVNVIAVNDAPVNTVPTEIEVTEDVAIKLTGISIADVDADGENVTVTLSIPNGSGTLTAAGDANVLVSGSATSLVLTGSVADINAYLSSGTGVIYTPALNANSDVTLTVTTNDLGNNGLGGALLDVDTVRLDLHAVNDAPVLAPNTNTIAYTENGSAVKLMPTATVTDPDNPSDFEDGFIEVKINNAVSGDRIVLTDNDLRVQNGDIQVRTGGNSWQSIGEIVSGSIGGTSVKIELDDDATDARVEKLLRALSYESTSDNPGATSRDITVTFNDGSNDGSGPALSDSSTITVNVTPVNDAPVLTGHNDLDTIAEDPISNPGTTVAKLLSLHDMSNPNYATDADNGVAGIAVTGVNAQGGGTWQYQHDGGAWTAFSPSSSASLLLDLDDLVRFVPNANVQTTQSTSPQTQISQPTITFRAWDGSTGTAGGTANTNSNGGSTAFSDDPQTATVTITSVNDAPVLTGDLSASVNEGASYTILAADLGYTDVDDNNAGVTFTVSSLSNGSVRVNGNPATSFTGTQLAAGQVTFVHNGSETTAASLKVRVEDGNEDSSTPTDSTFTFSVNPINDAPINSAPGTQSATEDVAKSISGLSISDADAGSGNLTTTLSVQHGTLTVTGAGVSGSGTGTVTITGTLAQINAALGTVSYLGNLNYNGADTLSMLTKDGGNTGSGGEKQDSDSVTINVSAVNDAPVATVPVSAYSATEQVNLNLHNTGLQISDVDAGNDTIYVTLSVSHGIITISAGNSGISDIDDNGTGSVRVEGSVSAINNLLKGIDTGGGSAGTIVYNANSDAPPATATLTLYVNDTGDNGSGGAKDDTKTATINIAAVNDAPVLTLHGAISGSATDDFGSGYSGGSGWAGDWVQNDQDNEIYPIDPVGVVGGNWLRLGDGSGDTYIERAVDLSGMTTASITFDVARVSLQSGQDLFVQAWNSQTNQFDTIGTVFGNGTSTSATFNLSAAHMSANSKIRFLVDNDLNDGDYFRIDNVSVNYSRGPVQFVENGPAVVLDGAALVADHELDAINNYNGATLTLNRQGGANSDDVFGATGTLQLSGGNVVLASTTVGTFTQANGQLVITFNGNATSAGADSVLRQLTYANNDDTPDPSVNIAYSFSDGGVAGTPGPLTATGVLNVLIQATNDAPTATDGSRTFDEDQQIMLATSDFGSYGDVDGTVVSVRITELETDGSLQFFNGTTWVDVTDEQVITLADIGANKLRFTPGLNENGVPYATIKFVVVDNQGASSAERTLTLNVNSVLDQVFTDNGESRDLRTFGPAPSSATDNPWFEDGNYLDAKKGNDTVYLPNATNGLGQKYTELYTAGGIFTGGEGNDTIIGGDLDDRISGGVGSDNLQGGAGNDEFFLGDDVVVGAGQTRTLDLGDGTTRQIAIGGLAGTADTVAGGSGYDTINLNQGAGAAFVHDTRTAPSYLSGIEAINGTAGDDVIIVNPNYMSDAAGGGIVIEGGQGKDTLGGGLGTDTIRGGEGDDVISGLGGADVLEGGTGSDEIWGGAGVDTLDGGADDDTLIGGAGDDTILGGLGDDTVIHTVGDGNDTVNGGGEDGTAYPNYDVIVVKGDATARIFTIGTITTGTPIVGTPSNSTDVLVSYNGPNAGSVRMDEIERIVIQTGPAGDTIVIGDLQNTALATSTVVINSGGGNDVIDLTGYVGSIKIQINDSDPVATPSSDTDLVRLAGKWTDWTAVVEGDGYKLTKAGGVTVVVKEIESFYFLGDDATIPLSQLVNQGPVASDDAGSVVEDAIDTPAADNGVATGNVLGNDTDVNSLDTKTVQGVQFGDVDTEISGGLDTEIAGTYGKLTLSSTGVYVYTLDDANPLTDALAKDAPVSETFSYTVKDAAGATSTAQLVIAVKGTNDAPVITGQSVFVRNPGFENNTSYNEHGIEGDWTTGSPQGWTVSGPTHGGWFNPSGDSVLHMETDNGQNVLFLNDGQMASQELDATAVAGTYTLTFELGDRNDAPLTGVPSLGIRIYAGNTLVGQSTWPSEPADGADWRSGSVTATIQPGSAQVGQALRIEFQNLEQQGSGGSFTHITQINLDNVSMSVIPTLAMTGINENALDNNGQTVASILGATVSDVDAGAVEGIAIYGVTNGNGHWEYKDGGNWVTINPTGPTNAVLLAATDTVRFVPNEVNGTVASFQYFAWDQTSGTAHGTADVTNRGAATAFSIEGGSASIVVGGVNDAPVPNGPFAKSLAEPGDVVGINEAGPSGALVSNLALSTAATNALNAILVNPGSLETQFGIVEAALGGNTAQALAVVWKFLDSNYSYYNQPVAEAGVRLAAVYADYLRAGNMPLLEVTAKYTKDGSNGNINGGVANGTADRIQSLHDNLLGNVDAPSMADKFSVNPALLATMQAFVTSEGLAGRPIYSGDEGASNAATVAWDKANGFLADVTGTFTASDVDLPSDTLTWSGSTPGAHGMLTVNANGTWSYVLNPGAADALPQGGSATDAFTVSVSDGTIAVPTSLVITIMGTNDAPVITANALTAYLAPELPNGFYEAGIGRPTLDAASNWTATIDNAFAAHPGNFPQILNAISPDPAVAMAALWDLLDQKYVNNAWNPSTNESFIRLGIEYAKYLQSGGAPFLSTIAKYDEDTTDAGTDPDRVQTLHDNLLGNTSLGALAQRFNGPGNATYDALLAAIHQAGIDDVLQRPYYSGNEGSTNNALAWDMQHGYVPAASGQLTVTDVDSPSSSFTFTSSLTGGSGNTGTTSGVYGTFTVNANGAWTYTIDNEKLATRQLDVGDNPTESFTVKVTDDFGGVDTQVIVVNVTGYNDAPSDIALSNLTVPANNNAGDTIGTITVTDVDDTAFTFVVRNPNGSVNTDIAVVGTPGNYSLQVVNPAGVSALPPTISITATDDNGASHTELFALSLPVKLFSAANVLLGSYETIQGAVNAAGDGLGQYISAAVGTYTEDVTIDRGVEIRGANYGIDGTGTRGAETVINGQWTINTTSAVEIDGLRFNNVSPEGSGADATLSILKGGNGSGHVIENTVFFSAVDGGDTKDPSSTSGPDGDPIRDDRAIFVSTGATTGKIIIDDNLITGSNAGKYATASWGRGIWSDGNGVDLTISDNTISNTRSGMNLDATAPAPGTLIHVNGNTFTDVGTAVSLGANWSGDSTSAFQGNTFNNVDLEFNLQNLGQSITLNAGNSIHSDGTIENAVNDAFYILGGQNGDIITGTSYIDVIAANGGADFSKGGTGDDALDGGAGIDTAIYDANLTAANIATSGAGWAVTAGAAEGTDALFNTEIVDGAGAGRFLLVGYGGFATIQAAVNAAMEGDTILIAGGNYREQVVVDGVSNLTIRAATGAQVSIEAPDDLVETARSSSGRELNAVLTVKNATNVDVIGIDVDGGARGNTIDEGTGAGEANFVGVVYRNASGDLSNVDIFGVHDAYPGGNTLDGYPNQSGNQRGVGLQVDNDVRLAFTMTGGSISDFQKNATVINGANLSISGVTVTGGGAQTVNAQNGFQITNSSGSITGNTITAIGYAGPQNVYSAGMLLFHNTDLNVLGNIITGTNGATTAAKVVGIYVYDANGANSGGSISTNGLSYVDLGVGVYGAIGPNAITILHNTVTNLDTSDPYAFGLEFAPNPNLLVSFVISGTEANDYFSGARTTDVLIGGGGNDTFVYAVGGGNDRIDGGTETGTLNPNYDVLKIEGDAEARTFTLGKLAQGAANNIAPTGGTDLDDITVIYTGANGGTVRADEIEHVEFNAGSGAMNVVINDITGTSILPSTVVVNGGAGDDTLDLTSFAGDAHVVFNGNGGADTVIISDVQWKDATVSVSNGVYTLNVGGQTFDVSSIESVQFANGTVSMAQLIQAAPTDLSTTGLSVAENSANGSAVGSVTGVDINGTIDPLTYAFAVVNGVVQNAGGRFAINASTGQITVADGTLLDHESSAAHTVTVQVTDSKGASYAESFSVSVNDVYEAPPNANPIFGSGDFEAAVTGQVGIPAASAVINGGFESDGAGWTTSAAAGSATFGGFPDEGSGNFRAHTYGASSGAVSQVSQTLATLAGVQYTLSFKVAAVNTSADGSLYVSWNGNQVQAIAGNQVFGAYQTFSVAVTGTGSDTLTFAVDDPNLPAQFKGWYIDTVAVTPAAHYQFDSGTIAFSDVDASDTHTAIVAPAPGGYVGSFSASVDNVTNEVKWTFFASDTELQGLATASATQTYTITLDDGHGGTDTQDVTVTLNKHLNSDPVITSGTQTASAIEDASIGVVNLVQNATFELPTLMNPSLSPWTASSAGTDIAGSGANGTTNAVYLDHNSSLSQTIATMIGETYTLDFFLQNYGTPFTVQVNGSTVWSTSDVIGSWSEYAVTFTATAASTVISFATSGVNSASIDDVYVQAGSKHINEGIEENKGTITFTDTDLVDTHTASPGTPTVSWSGGSLTQGQITALTNASSLGLTVIDSTGTGTGSVAWKHSIADSALQFLAAGETLTLTYNVSITDSQGGVTTTPVTITVNGTSEGQAPTLIMVGEEDNVRDTFANVSYSRQDGTADWLNDWDESSDDDSPTIDSGNTSDDIGVNSTALRLSDQTSSTGTSGDNSSSSVVRSVDLSDAESATLSFVYRRVLNADGGGSADTVTAQISTDGSAWHDVLVITGSANETTYTPFEIDISNYMSDNTRIRFVAGGDMEENDFVYIDDVDVSYTLTPSFTEGGSAAKVIANATIVDTDSDNMASAKVVLNNRQTGDQLQINGEVLTDGETGTIAGINYVAALTANTIAITFTGSATKAQYETALEAVRFSNTSQAPNTTDRQFAVTITDPENKSSIGTTVVKVQSENDAPEITSGSSASVNENIATTTTVYQAVASDVDSPSLTYSLTGTDAARFDISSTGAVTFKQSPNHEAPNDSNTNNIYSFNVVVSDGDESDSQAVLVTVNDVVEPVSAGEPFAVGRGFSFTNADGTYGNQIIDLPSSLFSNPENASLTWSAALPSNKWSFSASNQRLIFQNDVPTGVYDVTIQASDGTATATQVIKVWIAGSTAASITANGSANHLIGTNSVDAINGGGGSDFIHGRGDADTLNGGTGVDVIYGGASSSAVDTIHGNEDADYINGNGGGDFLYGDAGADWLDGDSGNDWLDGGTGADTLVGGTGGDTFVIANSEAGIVDLIADYDLLEGDKVDLSVLFNDLSSSMTEQQAASYVKLDSDGTLSVNVTASGNPTDFVDVGQLHGGPSAVTIVLDNDLQLEIDKTI